MERKKDPDKNKALSLINNAKEDILFTLSIPIKDNSSNTIVRNIYESFRMMGESLLVIKGFESNDHVQSINELLKMNIETLRPIYLLDNLRKTRHKINYQGYKARIEDAEEAMSIAKACFMPIFKEIKKIIEKDK